MTAYVILAAGRGTRIGRVGESMHKALVPLEGEAIITHLLARAPDDARIAIMLGHRAEQVEEYVNMAHPDLDVTFIPVAGWDEVGGGPGLSLMAAREFVGDDDMLFTSCDTLWEQGDIDAIGDVSWAAVAPMPSGTTQDRWCRMVPTRDGVVIVDKSLEHPGGFAYTGLAYIASDDLDTFWAGLAGDDLLYTERQVTGGLRILAASQRLGLQHIHWTDVGDEAAYARAVALRSGYDWTKDGEATYVLPYSHRVIKFFADPIVAEQREVGRMRLGHAGPKLVGIGSQMLAYEYIHGTTAYEAVEADHNVAARIVEWAWETMWTHPIHVSDKVMYEACIEFYRNKTLQRISKLHPLLQATARDAVSRVDWDRLARGCVPVKFHGDFNFGNIMVDPVYGRFVGIDWRGDFAGYEWWGDMRYDMGKLVSGTVVHWDNARRGDFRPWTDGRAVRRIIMDVLPLESAWDVQVIGALSLINSAPLHASPLDEILVARGAAWLEEVL